MDHNMDTFVPLCLHCLRTALGKIPHPLLHALHAVKPNKLLHFDFSKGQCYSYVLVLKDYLSRYVWLLAIEAADADTVAFRPDQLVLCVFFHV